MFSPIYGALYFSPDIHVRAVVAGARRRLFHDYSVNLHLPSFRISPLTHVPLRDTISA
jgi:hypothetical protein